jgi:hypothetical protein
LMPIGQPAKRRSGLLGNFWSDVFCIAFVYYPF